jgi:hypothetical protein
MHLAKLRKQQYQQHDEHHWLQTREELWQQAQC